MHAPITFGSARTFQRERLHAILAAAPYAPALIFAAIATASGMPVLRHDWLTFRGRLELLHFTIATLAWQPSGIGSVRVYPTDYLFSIGNTIVSLVVGTQAALFLFVLMTGVICIYGARSLVRLETTDGWATFGLSLFALFNPWVYVKVIEGHLAMIASYGALMALVAELWRDRPRWPVAAILLAPMAQLQFFVLGMASCAVAGILRRDTKALVPLACGFVFAMPALVGFAVDGSRALATPYNIDWQTSQSIAPVDAAALGGFFANYLRTFPTYGFDAVWAVAALAVIGIVARPNPKNFAFAAVVFLAWLLATGTKGPFATPYRTAVQSFPPIELYRELYDLLALVGMGYIAIAAIATARFPILARAAIVPGLVLLASWIYSPPNIWWVGRWELPRVAVDAPPNSRFALYPDITPLHFGNRGAGRDPDAFPRRDNVTPANGDDPSFPADVALREYEISGDSSDLRALGVTRIYNRPWLTSDIGSASAVSSVAIESPSSRIAKGVDRIDGSPELSLLERIQVSRSLPPLGSGELFFGDVAGQSGASIPPAWATFDAVVPQSAARKRLSASEGWVDVRGAFIGQPELGQAIGGVVTTSRYSMLPVDAGRSILVNVLRGRLISSDGREVTRETVGYSWVTLPEGTKNVVCSGECVVAAEGTPPSLRSPSVPVALQMPLSAPVPWLAWTTLPPRNTETVLKYLVGYDRTMLAISRSGTLPHVRVETVFNGWLVAPHEGTRRVVLIDALAAVQVFLELTGLVLLLALSWLLLGVKRSNVEFSE